MPTRYVVIILALFATPAWARDDPLTYLKKSQPRDVTALIDRIVGCNHWRGEAPFDAERRQEIDTALKDLHCKRLANDEAKARRRYAKRPMTIKAILQAKETSY